jgi:hypothetical protein
MVFFMKITFIMPKPRELFSFGGIPIAFVPKATQNRGTCPVVYDVILSRVLYTYFPPASNIQNTFRQPTIDARLR